jgi:hypothetical protein
VHNSRDSTIGEPPTIIGDVTDITTTIHKTAVSEERNPVKNNTQQFPEFCTFGETSIHGVPGPRGLQWPIYATGGDNIASENT